MSAPFSANDLIFRSYFLSGVHELLSQVSPYNIRTAAEQVEYEYSDWDEDQGFGTSDFTYAMQRFLDEVISFEKVPYRTQFNPRLEVVPS
jgi:hypothetical protein